MLFVTGLASKEEQMRNNLIQLALVLVSRVHFWIYSLEGEGAIGFGLSEWSARFSAPRLRRGWHFGFICGWEIENDGTQQRKPNNTSAGWPGSQRRNIAQPLFLANSFTRVGAPWSRAFRDPGYHGLDFMTSISRHAPLSGALSTHSAAPGLVRQQAYVRGCASGDLHSRATRHR